MIGFVGVMEREQRDDMNWAARVLSGARLSSDSNEAATGMLENLRTFGATEDLKREADRLLRYYSAVKDLAA